MTKTKHIVQAVLLALFLCMIACSTPFFNRYGEQYQVVAVSLLLSCALAVVRPAFSRSDLWLIVLFVFALTVTLSHKSLHTPISLWRWAAAGLAFYCGRMFRDMNCLFAGTLVVPAFVQAIIVIFQRIGMLNSLSFFFPVSGTFGNPAQAAALITIGYAALLTIAYKKWAFFRVRDKIALVGLSLWLLSAIYISDTRSCWVSTIVVTAICFISSSSLGNRIIRAFLLVIIVSSCLYFLRPASANVRLLIWRSSSYIFVKHPLFGGGSTSFSSDYMLAQATYFTRHPDSPFLMIANDHNQPFNEVIRLLCEQGIAGTLLMIAIIVRKEKEHGSMPLCLISLLIVSLFYNVSDTFVLYLFFWMILGQMGRSDYISQVNTMKGLWPLLGFTTVIVSSCCLLNHHYMASDRWKPVSLSYRQVCKEGDLLMSQGLLEEAENRYALAMHMIPCRITAPFKLFKLLERSNPDNAIRWGRHILDDMKFQVNSGQTLQMKTEIRNGIDSLEYVFRLGAE